MEIQPQEKTYHQRLILAHLPLAHRTIRIPRLKTSHTKLTVITLNDLALLRRAEIKHRRACRRNSVVGACRDAGLVHLEQRLVDLFFHRLGGLLADYGVEARCKDFAAGADSLAHGDVLLGGHAAFWDDGVVIDPAHCDGGDGWMEDIMVREV